MLEKMEIFLDSGRERQRPGPRARTARTGGQCGWSRLWAGVSSCRCPKASAQKLPVRFALPSQGMGMGQNQTCCPPLSPGHSAPDEVSGSEALLHEHQLGAGELQQVCGSLPPCGAPPPPTSPSFPASASILRGGCNQPLLQGSPPGTGGSLPHTLAHFPLG